MLVQDALTGYLHEVPEHYGRATLGEMDTGLGFPLLAALPAVASVAGSLLGGRGGGGGGGGAPATGGGGIPQFIPIPTPQLVPLPIPIPYPVVRVPVPVPMPGYARGRFVGRPFNTAAVPPISGRSRTRRRRRR
jgi:hypothetical protein